MSPEPWVSRYIPAGCLRLAPLEDASSAESFKNLSAAGWKFLSRSQHDIPHKSSLPPISQTALLGHPSLRSIKLLWSRRWIQIAFRLQNYPKVLGYLRIYILPHDVESTIIRGQEDEKASKALAQLLSQLDFSEPCWNGRHVAVPQPFPKPLNPSDLPAGDGSLLAMFNSVPSPNPQPDEIPDLDTRETMHSIMNSKIPGLEVKLYPYQRASTALMLQREAFPGRIVDPRLWSVVDQEGKSWYFDPVTGVVLKEPRYYDGVSGGILAEEMGTGKTLMCLALILSTRHEPTRPPEPFPSETPTRPNRKGPCSLMDLAAATANRNAIAWKPYFEACRAQLGEEYRNCVSALERPENRAFYRIQTDAMVEPRRSGRLVTRTLPPPVKIFLSSTTLAVVPNNLVIQWKNEIKKHTSGLSYLILIDKQPIPPATALLDYDLILFSHGRFEWIQREKSSAKQSNLVEKHCPLEFIRFKRIIVDEGHRLGAGSAGSRTDVMRVVESLHTSARWVVTGTPSKGLYGVESQSSTAANHDNREGKSRFESTPLQEKDDLQRIGNLATKFLKARPWANTKDEAGDSLADWNVYVMSKKQHSRGQNRKDCLKSTLNSLIIRHRLDDVSTLLPPVDEKIVYLDGSYQDRLNLNLFSMIIIFNGVQSQRTDLDYFFHPRQRKHLIQLVNNLRQASFFGGVFFSSQDIAKSLETAEDFLKKKEVSISPEDEELLKQAMDFGRLAIENDLKNISHKFHSVPLYVEHFPGGNGKGWSLDEKGEPNSPVCTDSVMIKSLQQFLSPCIDAPTSLQLMIDTGRLYQQGVSVRIQTLKEVEKDNPVTEETQSSKPDNTLAGNTTLGNDHHPHLKSWGRAKAASLDEKEDLDAQRKGSNIELAEPLARTQIISTASAKLSYLIDAIVQHQHDEQILVFYDNDNIAYYLAGMLEILQIEHLIYARVGLNTERRARYVETFTQSSKFRVMLMDISQAAFGLDMRSASRIYFISPVLNPQVEAQAIGRARRISSNHLGKHVTVETLVLRDSIEEVMVDRKKAMSQAEFRRVNSILDDKPMFEWILNAKILPMPEFHESAAKGKGKGTEQNGCSNSKSEEVAQTALLKTPQFVFGRGFGRQLHPDDDLMSNSGSPDHQKKDSPHANGGEATPRHHRHHPVRPLIIKAGATNGGPSKKRSQSPSLSTNHPEGTTATISSSSTAAKSQNGGGESQPPSHPPKRARIAWAD